MSGGHETVGRVPYDPGGSGATWLFVYGTLRPGGRYWPQLEPWVERIGVTRRLAGHNLHRGPGYPLAAAVPPGWGGATGVVGEPVLLNAAVAAEALGVVDAIEGVPDLFARADRGGCWVYVATPTTLREVAGSTIASGDWFDVDPVAREAWENTRGVAYGGVSATGGE